MGFHRRTAVGGEREPMTACDRRDCRRFTAVAVLFEGGLGLIALVLGWLFGVPLRASIQWALPAVAGGAAATVPLLGLLWVCLRLPWAPLVELRRVVNELLLPLLRPARWWELAAISLLAGWGEELLFRGLLQQAIAERLGPSAGPWIGLAIASVVFGAVHWLTNAYAVLAGLIGVYLGGLWMATGNLLVPMVAHALYDFLALLYLVRLGRRAVAEGADPCNGVLDGGAVPVRDSPGS